jgi:hypothetical protein
MRQKRLKTRTTALCRQDSDTVDLEPTSFVISPFGRDPRVFNSCRRRGNRRPTGHDPGARTTAGTIRRGRTSRHRDVLDHA